ncbi:helix-turn-helix domain-containing protein, partial [Myroides sp. LoEW2-1]
ILFNVEYILMFFQWNLSDMLFDYFHLLLELSAVILSFITGVFILFTSIGQYKKKFSLNVDNSEKQVEINEENKDKFEYIIAEKIILFFESCDDYLQSNFTARQLSNEVGLDDQRQLNLITQRFFHLTFNELLAKYRIAHALELLKNKQNWSITSVAESSGFRSFTTFNKYFVHYVGIRASDYKDRNIKID